jgi:mRNA-degrading endonuclease RelE of RelBE toxin-antitoxin system
MVIITPSSTFKKAVKHLDEAQRNKLERLIKKILNNPTCGKPLYYGRGERSLRMKPMRLIYAYRKDKDALYLLKLDNRDSVYD